MKLSIYLVFSSFLSVTAFAAPLIDDGIKATNNAFPSVVKITTFKKLNKLEVPSTFCSGTLVAPNIVLTAAHCVAHEKDKLQRVSLVGDSKGATEKSKGGIRVIRTFSTSHYGFYSELYKKNYARLTTEEFPRLTHAEKQKIHLDILTSQTLSISYDIAFLELEENQVFQQGRSPNLGCRSSLVPQTEVTVAGYGKKAGKGPDQNLNERGVLHYGSNTIVHAFSSGFTYLLNKMKNKQLTNFGDSGGPLFKKNDTSTVYGVTSAGFSKEGRSYNVEMANLSSPSAHEIYSSILKAENMPKSLISILKRCVQ